MLADPCPAGLGSKRLGLQSRPHRHAPTAERGPSRNDTEIASRRLCNCCRYYMIVSLFSFLIVVFDSRSWSGRPLQVIALWCPKPVCCKRLAAAQPTCCRTARIGAFGAPIPLSSLSPPFSATQYRLSLFHDAFTLAHSSFLRATLRSGVGTRSNIFQDIDSASFETAWLTRGCSTKS